MGRKTRFLCARNGHHVSLVKVSRAAETSGPIGVVIDVDASRLPTGEVVVALSGDVDVFSVPRLRAALRDHLGHADIVLDMRGVVFCDSSALRVFVDAQRRSAAADRTLTIAHPSDAVRDLFDVSGLRGVLRVV